MNTNNDKSALAPASKGTLEFVNVVKDYGTGEAAVKGVSFRVEDGDLVTMLGPSGCGKTTILRMIAGLELPTGGQILLGGKDVTSQSAAQRNVSLVFQSYALFPHMSVMENVCYGLTVQGMKKPDAEGRANEAIKLLGLTGFERRLPSELSGGQQQRVAIARALAPEPAVLLCDEPTSALDPGLAAEVVAVLATLATEGMTMLMATHDLRLAAQVATRTVFLQDGVVVEAGPSAQIFGDAQDARTRQFVSMLAAG